MCLIVAVLEGVDLQSTGVAAPRMAREFGLPVGYSDHTLGIAISIAAASLGATVIEKHFTLDKTLPGPDHAASLDPGELTAMIAAVRAVQLALGNGVKVPSASELPVRELVRRSVTLVRDVAAGTAFGSEDLALLRPGSGIPPADLHLVPGRVAKRTLSAGETLSWADVE